MYNPRKTSRKEMIVPDQIRRIDYFYVTVSDKPGRGHASWLHCKLLGFTYLASRLSRTVRADPNWTSSREIVAPSRRRPRPRGSS